MTRPHATHVITSDPARNPFLLDEERPMTNAVPPAVTHDKAQVTIEQALASVLARVRTGDLRNPSVAFNDHLRDGEYDAMNDAGYKALLDSVELIAEAWHHSESLSDPATLVGRVALGGRDAWAAWLRVEPLTHGITAAPIGSLDPVPLDEITLERVTCMQAVAKELEGMFADHLGDLVANPAVDLARHERRGETVIDAVDRDVALEALGRLSRDLWHDRPREHADTIAGRALSREDCGESVLADLRTVHHLINKHVGKGDDRP